MYLGEDMCLAIDLDGTLLNSQGKLSGYSKTILNAFSSLGNKIIFVTGRNVEDAVQILTQAELTKAYVIIDDGQEILEWNKDNQVRTIVKIPGFIKEDLIEILKWCKKNKYDCTLYMREGFLSISYGIKFYLISLFRLFSNRNKHGNKLYNFKNVKKYLDSNIIKIAIRTKKIQKCFLKFNEDYQHSFYYVINDNMLEIKPKNSGKKNALLKLLELLHINKDDCWYFGNGGNDAECLSFFANSCAVQNACEEAKNAAKMIIGVNDDDAVAHFIEDNLLKKQWSMN